MARGIAPNKSYYERNKHKITPGLTADDVSLIRAMVREADRLKAEMSQLTTEAIAEKFDVKPSVVQRIRSGKSWPGVE